MKKFDLLLPIFLVLYSNITYSQQSIDAYIKDSVNNVFKQIASSTNSLVSPVDLDFYPDQTTRPNELWILNQGTNATGGSTEIVFDANKSTRTYKYVKDGNAWHFMAMASAIAFGNVEWATSADILDANRTATGKYTGPTLWPGDLSVYGIVGNPSTASLNGSHLSMIHQSPYGKGIAFERDLVFWVLDGYEGNIKRYDFGIPHDPGGDDHSGGNVRVFPDFKFVKHASLPSHIVIDAEKKYLYGCDPVDKRIFRIDITTGSNKGTAVKVNSESLLSYRKYTGLVIENIITSGLTSPVGIDVYGERLLVTDNGTDQIIIYDVSNNFSEVGRINLKYAVSPDPMGIKIGPDGKIYFVDKLNKGAYMIENSNVIPLAIKSLKPDPNQFSLIPNPASTQISLHINNLASDSKIKIINAIGQEVLSKQLNTQDNFNLDIQTLLKGIYYCQLYSNNKVYTQKFIKI
ncbi:MAG TPA: T9SS type A sorting domain-containing protein [Saprospiraceae bacterium]|nr:T9SS type A sorting domain-containing protein [Saprospiraceae bacterium]